MDRPTHGSGARTPGTRFVVMLFCFAGSCAAPRPPLVVTDPDPSVKIPAIQKAVRSKDRSVVPQLIKDLESDDAAVRLYANRGLEELTGEHFGFRYFDDDEQREVAVQRWKRWFSEQQATRPGGGGAGSRNNAKDGAAAATRASTGPS